MTRSTNYSELRKMSNPIPINISAWQMRSQKKIDDTTQYDPGIMDQCVHNSVSPRSGYSISPSPSQSISPFTDPNRSNRINCNHTSTVQKNYQMQQIDQNPQFSQLLNENSQSSSHFDVQSELESLFVNATLSDGTLATNISQNDDNSNNSAKFAPLTNDELCDIDMNFDAECSNYNNQQCGRNLPEIDNNNNVSSLNSMIKLETIGKKDTTEKEEKTISRDKNANTIASMSMLSTSGKEIPKLSCNSIHFNEKTLETNTCDPVLTQIALNTTTSNTDVVHVKNNNNSNSNTNFLINKRNLFNHNNTDDCFLPSINISNLTAHTTGNQVNASSNSSSNFINTVSDATENSVFEETSNSQTLGLPLNIFKINNSTNNNTAELVNSFGPYSMSLPANYSNYMEFASSNFNTPSSQLQMSTAAQEPGNGALSSIDVEIDERNLGNIPNGIQNTSNLINMSVNENQMGYTCMSMSLPAYTPEDYMMKFKQQNINSNQSQFYPNSISANANTNLISNCNNRVNIMSSPHLNKLLLSNTKILSSFNSDSNLSCTNTAVSSLASMASPLSSVQDDFENQSSIAQNLNKSNNTITNSLQDDDFDEIDSDDDSINNDAFFDLMNKNRDTYFWQYNIQSKGPKTKKVLTLRNKDPHLHRDFFDPVYQLQTINSRGTSLNKLRKGDGNDVTPNSDKLFNLGLQIHDFIQKSYQMNSANAGPDTTNNEKVNLKREKNKIASRACRLKKKAQHEANKLKLHGLNQEHKQLVEAINIAKELIKKRLKNDLPQETSLVEALEDVCKQKLSMKVAGNTDNYVYSLMQSIENDRMNNLPTAKSNSSDKRTLTDFYSVPNEMLVNNMMLIDNSVSDNEKLETKGNSDVKYFDNV